MKDKHKELIRQYINETGQYPFYPDNHPFQNKKTKEFKKWLEKKNKYNTPYKRAVIEAYKEYKADVINKNYSEDKKKVYLTLNKLIRELFLDGHSIHQIKLPTGIGKSHIVAFYVYKISEICIDIDGFVILSSEYKNGADAIETILNQFGLYDDKDFIYLKGKKFVCEELETVLNEKGNKVEEFLEHNIPIDHFCDDEREGCPNRSACTYYSNSYKTYNENSNITCLIGVHHHYNNALPLFLMTRKLNIILIFEEDIESAIQEQLYINLGQINIHRDFLNLIKQETEIKINEIREKQGSIKQIKHIKEYLEYITYLDNFLIELRKSILSDNHTINYINLQMSIMDLFDYIKDNIIDTNSYLNDLTLDLYEKIKNNEYPLFRQLFTHFHTLVKNYDRVFKNQDFQDEEKWIKNTFVIMEDKYNKGSYIIDIFYYDSSGLTYLLDNDRIKEIIHNDATGNKEYLEIFYGKNDKRDLFIKEYDYLGEGISEIIYKNVTILQLKTKYTFKETHNPNKEFGEQTKTTLQHEKTLIKMLGVIKDTIKYLPNKLKPILTGSRKITSKQMFVDKELIERNPNYISLKSQKKSFGRIVKELDKSIDWIELPASSTNVYINYRTSIIVGRPDLPYNPKESISISERKAFSLNKTDLEYRDFYSRKTILQFNGRIIRFVEGVELLIILLTGFKVYSKEFIEGNKIKYFIFDTYKQLRDHIKIYGNYKILKIYLLKNKTITNKQAMIFFKIGKKPASNILFNMHELKLLKRVRKSKIEGGHHYFLK